MIQTLTTTQWILVDVANTFGYDKGTFDNRITKALNIVNFSGRYVLNNAENPWLCQRAINSYWMNNESHIVALDAKTQALQLYAVLTGDLETAMTCGLCKDDSNQIDAYSELKDSLNKTFGTDFFTRNFAKKPLMVTTYGHSKAYLELTEGMNKEEEEEYYANYFDRMDDMYQPIIEAIIPSAIKAMSGIQALNKADIGTYNWTLPDNFNVKYVVKSKLEYKSDVETKTGLKLTLSVDTKVFAPSEKNKGMAPNVVHSVDGYLARQIIRGMGNKFISTIHDSFSVEAKNCNLLREVYIDEMIKILESDLLNNIMTEIADGTAFKPVPKLNTLTAQHIKDANYALA